MRGFRCGSGYGACECELQSSPVRSTDNVLAPLKRGPLQLFLATALFLTALVLQLFCRSLPLPHFREALFLIAFVLAGSRTIAKAAGGARRGFFLNENILMTLAAVGAIALGDFPEAAAVMILFNLGELFEESAVNRSRRSIAALMETKPDYANLISTGGAVEKVSPEKVCPGDVILVRPGEKIALDGEVISGCSAINNAALTGEAVPLQVERGDSVPAGAVNGSGLLQIRVSRPFAQSSLAQIYRLVQESAARKAPVERFMTAFARRYTPAVVAGALLLAIVPPLIIPGAVFSTWLYRALIFLVISCPCALVISIPLGYLGGIAAASRQGILIKGGNFMESLRKVKIAVFDKTGTITEGVFRVTEIIPAPGVSRAELLDLAAHAEAYSHHPLARSVREAFGGNIRREAITSYREMGGLGVKAMVHDKTVLAGNLRLLRRESVSDIPSTPVEGAIHVAVEGRYAGSLVMGDQLRHDTARAVELLKNFGVRRTVMLTGDAAAAAQEIARLAGIDLAYASLMPGEKVAHLEALLEEAASAGGKLAYIGDGINDAPALSRADVGIAMGGAGSDAAIEAADVVIMDDQLPKIAEAMRVSAFTYRIVLQNIVFSLGVKGLFLAAGAFGAVSIWGALFADVGVALLAIANTARLLWAGSRKKQVLSGITKL